MSLFKRQCSEYINHYIHNYPLLVDYQQLIEDFIVFHFVASGVRYKKFGKKNFEKYINDRETKDIFEYHTARHQFFNISLKTKALKKEREKRNVQTNSEYIDVFNYWDELEILLVSNGENTNEAEKSLRTTLGQISRSNLEAMTFDKYQSFVGSYRNKIEDTFAPKEDELELPLHLYMFERNMRFNMMKLYCKVLEDYNLERGLPKTPQKEHALTYIELLRIPSLAIANHLLTSENFNPSDYQQVRDFNSQLICLLTICSIQLSEHLSHLYDMQSKYHTDIMKKNECYYDPYTMSEAELLGLGITKREIQETNKHILQKKMNMYSFIRAITTEEDINIFYKEADEDNYLNNFNPRGAQKDFSINTFNKIKILLTSIIQRNN